MTPQKFIDIFDTVAEAPGGTGRLRELVLQLAVRGKLVPQDAGDESAAVLLKHIADERARLVQAKQISKQKPVPDLDHSATAVELPSGWIWTCTAALGIVNPRNVAEDDAMVSFCPMPAIPTDYRQPIVPETRRWSDVKKGYTHFAEGDVVVAKITPCFQNRKSCVMTGLEGGVGAGTTELHVIRIIANIVVPEYLLLFYKSPDFIQMGVATMTGTAGQQRVPRQYFAYTPLPLPPLSEQHRIVAKVDELMGIVDRLDSARRSREDRRTVARKSALIALQNASKSEEVRASWSRIADRIDDLFIDSVDLAHLREAVLQLAVRGKLVPQDAAEESASVLLRKIENDSNVKPERKLTPINEAEIPYRLPSSWTWIRLQQIANFSMGKTPPTKDTSYWSDGRGFAWVSISDMDHFRSVSETKRRVSKKAVAEVFNCQPVPAGTILMSFKLTIGKIARLGVDAYHNEAIVSLYPIVHEMDAYLFQFMPLFSSGGSSKGAIKGRTLNSNSLSNLLVALPPLAEQQRIIAKVDQLFKLIERLENYLDNCEKSNRAFVSAFISNEVSRHNSSGIP